MAIKICNNPVFLKIKTFNQKLDRFVLGKKLINKIQSKSVREYLLSVASGSVLFWKLINLTWICLLVMVSGFLMRSFAINLVLANNGTRVFGSIFHLTLNNGIALGSLGNKDVGLVYFLQSLPIIIGIISFLFVKSWYYYIPLLFLLFGGLGNIIDRTIPELELKNISGFSDDPNARGGNVIYHGVVDYWRFANSVINIFDVYIVVAIGFLVLSMIITIIVKWKEEEKKQTKKPDDTPDWISKASDQTSTDICEVGKKQFAWDQDLPHEQTQKEKDQKSELTKTNDQKDNSQA